MRPHVPSIRNCTNTLVPDNIVNSRYESCRSRSMYTVKNGDDRPTAAFINATYVEKPSAPVDLKLRHHWSMCMSGAGP